MFRMYSSLFVIKFKNEMSYRTSVILSSIMMMLYSVISIFIWLAVYTFSHTASIHGVALSTTLIYFVIIGALSPMLSWSGIADNLYTDIKEGSIATSVIRPMSYTTQLIITDVAQVLPNILIVSIPIIIAVALLANLAVTPATAAVFLIYLLIGYIMATLFAFIIGSLAFYLTDIYGIMVSLNWGITMIGGSMLPLVFFPQWIEHILLMLPFAYMAFTPAATLTGMLSLNTAISLLPVAGAWIAVLLFFVYFVWKKMSVRMDTVGQ